jgi:transmembrane sensor
MDLELALKYMTDSATETERLTFEKWMAQAEPNRKEYEHFLSEWDKSKATINEFKPDTKRAWDDFSKKVSVLGYKKQARIKTFKIFQWRAVAAAVVLLVATTLFVLYKTGAIQQHETYTVYSTLDSLKSIQLPDGSEVCLNTHSELKVPKWRKNNERKVYLSGEAFFEVTHNPGRPFIVQTAHTTTRVLGTSFNLKASEMYDVVSLITGKVEFHATNTQNAVILAPGEMISYNHSNKQLEKLSFQDKNFMAWKTKKLEFNNSSISNVIRSISEYYHVSVSGNFTGFEEYSLTADFNNQPVEKVLSVLEITWDAQMSIRNDTLYIDFN